MQLPRGPDRVYFARDSYSEWKKRVVAAKHSVRVFTPDLDGVLVSLLRNSGSDARGVPRRAQRTEVASAPLCVGQRGSIRSISPAHVSRSEQSVSDNGAYVKSLWIRRFCK